MATLRGGGGGYGSREVVTARKKRSEEKKEWQNWPRRGESAEEERLCQGKRLIAVANRFSVSPMTHPPRRRCVKCISWPGAS